MRIDLPITTPARHTQRVVPATIVKVGGHLAATFAVHRAHDVAGLWRVTHVETGMSVAEGNGRAEAVLLAGIALSTLTQGDIDKAEAAALRAAPWINGGDELFTPLI